MLYGKCEGKLLHLEFRLEFIGNFFQTYGKNVTILIGPNPLWIVERNFPDYAPSTDKKSNATRVCIICVKKRYGKGEKYGKSALPSNIYCWYCVGPLM